MYGQADMGGSGYRRIVVLLISLALLAERVALRPFPVRFLVLSILRPAEAIAWRLVTGEAAPPDEGETPASLLSGPAEAARLARGFRMLALAFAEIAELSPACPSPVLLREFTTIGATMALRARAAVPLHDTS